ncbi:hypothetical protein A0R60_3954 [Enterobacter asburiae]|nr:hypothetical protein A0R60_3954 [Enterobacter asburiae]CAE7120098.1 hypothetical protein AI2694V1_3980 [Enterobacter cloacae]CAE7509799.1 hypothetical protein AI2674V1_3968 [Enterobacter cloacae]CAE7535695.1 hypothetical protein AI2679V1_3981 [Enterobacter cloacae]CAH3857888.1 hypothetical protein AI2679V1_3981 [Enterobacter cloacae]
MLKIGNKFTFCNFMEAVLNIFVHHHIPSAIDKVLFTKIIQGAVLTHRYETFICNMKNYFDIAVYAFPGIFLICTVDMYG